jgi:hypothetical protein
MFTSDSTNRTITLSFPYYVAFLEAGSQARLAKISNKVRQYASLITSLVRIFESMSRQTVAQPQYH